MLPNWPLWRNVSPHQQRALQDRHTGARKSPPAWRMYFSYFRLWFFSFFEWQQKCYRHECNSVAFPVFAGHVQAAQHSQVAACFSRRHLFDLVSFATSRRLLVCQQCGAETTLVCRCVFAVSLRVQRIIADVSCVKRHHAARSASAPEASVRFVHNGGPRPFLHSFWTIVLPPD